MNGAFMLIKIIIKKNWTVKWKAAEQLSDLSISC